MTFFCDFSFFCFAWAWDLALGRLGVDVVVRLFKAQRKLRQRVPQREKGARGAYRGSEEYNFLATCRLRQSKIGQRNHRPPVAYGCVEALPGERESYDVLGQSNQKILQGQT